MCTHRLFSTNYLLFLNANRTYLFFFLFTTIVLVKKPTRNVKFVEPIDDNVYGTANSRAVFLILAAFF